MRRKIPVRAHKRRLKDGRVLYVRRHDRHIQAKRHRRVGVPEITSSVSSKVASQSIKKQLLAKELELNAHTNQDAMKRLEHRDAILYDPAVERIIRNAAPSGIGVSKGATKQLNAELTSHGQEVTRRALKHMQNDQRTTLLARDIIAANEEIELQRRTSKLYGTEFNVDEAIEFGTSDEKHTAQKIKKLYS